MGPKTPVFSSRKRRKQSSPFLRFFFRVLFLLRRVFRKVLCIELCDSFGRVFVWIWVCVFVWILLSVFGSSCFFAVLGTGWPLFRGPFFFFSPLSPSSSPFLSRSRPGFSFFLFCVPADRTSSPGRGRSGLAIASFAFCLFCLFSLPGSAPLSLALSLSFLLSLSFFLSLSLACSAELSSRDGPSIEVKGWTVRSRNPTKGVGSH